MKGVVFSQSIGDLLLLIAGDLRGAGALLRPRAVLVLLRVRRVFLVDAVFSTMSSPDFQKNAFTVARLCVGERTLLLHRMSTYCSGGTRSSFFSDPSLSDDVPLFSVPFPFPVPLGVSFSSESPVLVDPAVSVSRGSSSSSFCTT